MMSETLFTLLKGLDSQNQTLIILVQQLRKEVSEIKRHDKATGVAKIREALMKAKERIVTQNLQIKQLKKDNKELHGFLSKETKDIKFV